MRHRAATVAGMLAAAALLLSACSSGGSEWTTVNLDGEVRTGDGPTFHPGERLLIEFPDTCIPPGRPGVTLWQKHARNNDSESYLSYRLALWFVPDGAVDSVPFVLPETIVGGAYELSADCGRPGDDTPAFYGRWDVSVAKGKPADDGGSGAPKAEKVEGRVVLLTGLEEYRRPDLDSVVSVLCLKSATASGECADNAVFYYSIGIDLILARGQPMELSLPDESRAEVVLPDEIPAGEYLMTPGPEGEERPVVITLGEP